LTAISRYESFERFISTAGAEALEIEGDIRIAEFFEVTEQLGPQRFLEKAGKIVGIYFNSRQI
jgi:hypothetical protein